MPVGIFRLDKAGSEQCCAAVFLVLILSVSSALQQGDRRCFGRDAAAIYMVMQRKIPLAVLPEGCVLLTSVIFSYPLCYSFALTNLRGFSIEGFALSAAMLSGVISMPSNSTPFCFLEYPYQPSYPYQSS